MLHRKSYPAGQELLSKCQKPLFVLVSIYAKAGIVPMKQKNTFLYELLDLYLAQFKVSPLIPISQADLWFKFLGSSRLAFSY